MSTTTQKIHISHSQINEFLRCPRKYHLHRRLQIPPAFTPAPLIFGGAVHEALAAYHQARLEGQQLGPDTLMEVFDERWMAEERPVRYGNGENKESLRDKAYRMMETYLEDPRGIGPPVAVEEKIDVSLREDLPPVWGRIDLLEQDEDGRLVLTDFKTASSRRSKDPSQLVLYREALRILGYPGVEDAQIRYVVLLKTKEPAIDVQVPELEGGELNRLVGLYRAAWHSIQNGTSHPVTGWWCRDCQWKHKCDQA
ncbi:MAG: RecB family exonuclease [Candidatus Brocadiia bacterium]